MSENHMYHLPSEWITISDKGQDMNTSENFMTDACITDKSRLWHARLCHSNVERIKRMSENPLYQARERGIHIKPAELTKYKEDFCTADEPEIEKFNVDFTGPNPTESIHGFLYSNAQKLKRSKAQKLRSSEAQKLRSSAAQKLRSSASQQLRSSEAQKLRSSKAQKLRSSEAQQRRSSAAQKLRSSKAQKLRSSEAQKLGSSEA